MVVEAEGTPYEIGLAHGSKAKEKVHNSLIWYRKSLTASSGIDWEGIKNFSKRYVSYIEKYDIDMIDEMKGIADRAGVAKKSFRPG
jgi:hypothetical protein